MWSDELRVTGVTPITAICAACGIEFDTTIVTYEDGHSSQHKTSCAPCVAAWGEWLDETGGL